MTFTKGQRVRKTADTANPEHWMENNPELEGSNEGTVLDPERDPQDDAESTALVSWDNGQTNRWHNDDMEPLT